MEFKSISTTPPPKNLYPCLAHITVFPPGADVQNRQRRFSAGSAGSGGVGGTAGGEEGGNPLTRIVSGGRRKSSFGQSGADGHETRRKSFFGSIGGGGSGGAGDSAVVTGAGAGGGGGEQEGGKWYWRVQAGVTDTHLVLLPLTTPANPVLTSPPAPLSTAIPSHSVTNQSGQQQQQRSTPAGTGTTTEGEEGFTDKIKHLFRRQSTQPTTLSQQQQQQQGQHSQTSNDTASAATAVEGERVLDQTAAGEQLSGTTGSHGAVNANAESGWPGVLANGEKLGLITVDLRGVEQSKVTVSGGGYKKEGSFVTVPITSAFASMVHGMLEPIGTTHHNLPKAGTIRFEFDKDWIGAKGEAELLQYHITQALDNLPNFPPPQLPQDRAIPQATEFQLGQGRGQTQQPTSAQLTGSALDDDVAPDQRVSA